MILTLLLASLIATLPADQQMSSNVLLGAKYEYSFPAGGSEKNDKGCTRLNNIWIAPSYNVHDYNNLSGAEYYDIDFKLSDTKSIYAVEADCIHAASWGIYLPTVMEVYASTSGSEFTLVGRTEVSNTDKPFTKQLVHLDVPQEFSADVLKVRFYRRKALISLDELRAFAYDPEGHILPGQHTDEAMDAYGTPLITNFLPMGYDLVKQNTPAQDAFRMFADGNKEEYVKFIRGGGRHVVWDLKKPTAVSGFQASFLKENTSGIYVPPVLAVSVSNDAKTWTTVSAQATGQYLPDMPKVNQWGVWYDNAPRSTWEYNAEFAPVKARYVRLSFEVNRVYTAAGAVYISEAGPVLCPKGTRASTVFTQTDSHFGHYPAKETAGFNACFYASVRPLGSKDWEKRQFTDEQALRMFIHDGDKPFFDAVCFTTFGFGASVEELLNTYFDDRYNLASVERAMDKLCQASGKDYKVGVWCSIKDVKTAAADFDKFLKMFNEKGYKHLYVLGSYWENEGDNYNVQNELREVNAHVHSLGYKTFWCPYYGQAAIWHWKDFGFDIACLQPNTMFHGHAADDLYMTCEVARLCGMSVEMEIDSPKSDVVCSLYADYLRAQVASGADKSCKVFYIGGSPNALLEGADSGLPYAASLLEDSYKFVTEQ